MPGLDYSAARLSGEAIRAAGFDFVVRYVGTPKRTKNITAAEYADLTAAGVAVALVYEDVAGDAKGGWSAGVASARDARVDADSIGFPADRPIYMAIDDVNAGAYLGTAMDYLDGAASVLGRANVGVYGFQRAISAAMAGGHAQWFWQCGAVSALVPGCHLYQHNNDNTTVAGITCDVNDALADDFGQHPSPSKADIGGFLVALTDWQQQRIFDRVLSMSQGVDGENFDGPQFAREQQQRDVTSQQLAAIADQLAALLGAVSQEEAALMAAVRGVQAGQVDVAALASALVPLLPTNVTTDEIVAAFAAHLSTPTGGTPR